MTTRQELYTAIGLIRQTCRMNRHGDSLVSDLQGLGDYSEPEEPDRLTPYIRQHNASKNTCNVIYETSNKLDAFLDKVDTKHIDAGIDAIPVPVTRVKINNDVSTSKTLSTNAKPLIEAATKEEDLSALSDPFESYLPQCGVLEPDPMKLFSQEINYANILHDILDAMSYELQGKNSYTGEMQYLTSGQFEALIINRLFTAKVYLSHLPNSVDKQLMADTVSYVRNNFDKTESIILGQYIDSHIPKHIIVRRWWAL